jgi:hypothetical protein
MPGVPDPWTGGMLSFIFEENLKVLTDIRKSHADRTSFALDYRWVRILLLDRLLIPEVTMCQYATLSKFRTRRASQRFLRVNGPNEQFSLFGELNFLIKLTASLWVLVAVTSVLLVVGMQFQPKVRNHGEFRPGSLLASGPSWQPGEYQSGECGALEDRNMRRVDGAQLYQLVDNPPPGYDVPFRQP